MAPDQQATEASSAFTHSNAVIMINGVRAAVAAVAIQYVEDKEQLYEPVIPTTLKLEWKRYDRINAHRSDLQQVARAQRHLERMRKVRRNARKKKR